ncbi:unnamed protein product [Amoebophrya sp. A120]|nr:unnamed protein product [Amoebophrya sp. A120]|eukprot:GSA120T00009418001.1
MQHPQQSSPAVTPPANQTTAILKQAFAATFAANSDTRLQGELILKELESSPQKFQLLFQTIVELCQENTIAAGDFVAQKQQYTVLQACFVYLKNRAGKVLDNKSSSAGSAGSAKNSDSKDGGSSTTAAQKDGGPDEDYLRWNLLELMQTIARFLAAKEEQLSAVLGGQSQTSHAASSSSSPFQPAERGAAGTPIKSGKIPATTGTSATALLKPMKTEEDLFKKQHFQLKQTFAKLFQEVVRLLLRKDSSNFMENVVEQKVLPMLKQQVESLVAPAQPNASNDPLQRKEALSSSSLPELHATLLFLRGIFKGLEMSRGLQRGPFFEKLIQVFFPVLRVLADSVLENCAAKNNKCDDNQGAAAHDQVKYYYWEVTRLVLKMYYHAVYHSLDQFIVENLEPWMTVVYKVIEVNGKQGRGVASSGPENNEAAAEVSQLSSLKWALRICFRMFHKHLKVDLDEASEEVVLQKFQEEFKQKYALVMTKGVLSILDLFSTSAATSSVTATGTSTASSSSSQQKLKKSKTLTLLILTEACDFSSCFKELKPQMQIVIEKVCFPLLCFNASDIELYEQDPEEFLRIQTDCFAMLKSPRSAAEKLVKQLAKHRTQAMFLPTMSFLSSVFASTTEGNANAGSCATSSSDQQSEQANTAQNLQSSRLRNYSGALNMLKLLKTTFLQVCSEHDQTGEMKQALWTVLSQNVLTCLHVSSSNSSSGSGGSSNNNLSTAEKLLQFAAFQVLSQYAMGKAFSNGKLALVQQTSVHPGGAQTMHDDRLKLLSTVTQTAVETIISTSTIQNCNDSTTNSDWILRATAATELRYFVEEWKRVENQQQLNNGAGCSNLSFFVQILNAVTTSTRGSAPSQNQNTTTSCALVVNLVRLSQESHSDLIPETLSAISAAFPQIVLPHVSDLMLELVATLVKNLCIEDYEMRESDQMCLHNESISGCVTQLMKLLLQQVQQGSSSNSSSGAGAAALAPNASVKFIPGATATSSTALQQKRMDLAHAGLALKPLVEKVLELDLIDDYIDMFGEMLAMVTLECAFHPELVKLVIQLVHLVCCKPKVEREVPNAASQQNVNHGLEAPVAAVLKLQYTTNTAGLEQLEFVHAMVRNVLLRFSDEILGEAVFGPAHLCGRDAMRFVLPALNGELLPFLKQSFDVANTEVHWIERTVDVDSSTSTALATTSGSCAQVMQLLQAKPSCILTSDAPGEGGEDGLVETMRKGMREFAETGNFPGIEFSRQKGNSSAVGELLSGGFFAPNDSSFYELVVVQKNAGGQSQQSVRIEMPNLATMFTTAKVKAMRQWPGADYRVPPFTTSRGQVATAERSHTAFPLSSFLSELEKGQTVYEMLFDVVALAVERNAYESHFAVTSLLDAVVLMHEKQKSVFLEEDVRLARQPEGVGCKALLIPGSIAKLQPFIDLLERNTTAPATPAKITNRLKRIYLATLVKLLAKMPEIFLRFFVRESSPDGGSTRPLSGAERFARFISAAFDITVNLGGPTAATPSGTLHPNASLEFTNFMLSNKQRRAFYSQAIEQLFAIGNLAKNHVMAANNDLAKMNVTAEKQLVAGVLGLEGRSCVVAGAPADSTTRTTGSATPPAVSTASTMTAASVTAPSQSGLVHELLLLLKQKILALDQQQHTNSQMAINNHNANHNHPNHSQVSNVDTTCSFFGDDASDKLQDFSDEDSEEASCFGDDDEFFEDGYNGLDAGFFAVDENQDVGSASAGAANKEQRDQITQKLMSAYFGRDKTSSNMDSSLGQLAKYCVKGP